MVVSKAAKRYASALLSLAVESKQVEAVLKDVESIASTIATSRELLLFLRSPIIRRDRKRATLKAVFEGRLTTLTMAFLDQLCKRNRESDLQSICVSFKDQFDAWAGIERVTVTSAFPLESKQIESVKASLKTFVNRNIVINQVIDDQLIGGIQIKIADTVYDGSVRAQLNKMEAALSSSVA
jgi:F-type H+-transporting ATPase subunit delta